MALRKNPSDAQWEAAWNRLAPAVDRIARQLQLLEMQSRDTTREQRLRHFVDGVELEKLLCELLSFALPPGRLKFEQIEDSIRESYRGLPERIQKWALFEATKGRRGRPVVRRHTAALALAWREKNGVRTWREAAERFCACGKSSHDSSCVSRTKRDALRLKALLRDNEQRVPDSGEPPVHK